MKLNEETFLSAYLDGDLDAGQRRRVESTLLSDARLSDDLRDLTAVRDLIAGLGRPSPPVDVSDPVMATIRRRRDAALWSARVVALVSAAAALVAVASLGLGEHGPDVARRPAPAGSGPAGKLLTRVADERAPIRLVSAYEPAPGARSTAPSREERRRDREQLQVRNLLESPNLRKVLIVTDVIGGDASRQVGELIEKTPRRSATYGRLTVSQGILIDPEHPGEATVFAVVLDDHELAQFRAKLDESFPKAVQEAEPRSEVMTNLAEVGQVAVFPETGSNVANLIDPSVMLNTALKSEPRKFGDLTRLVPEAPGVDPLQDTDASVDLEDPLQEPDRTAAADRNRDRATPRERRRPPDASVVLVWVATHRRDGPP